MNLTQKILRSFFFRIAHSDFLSVLFGYFFWIPLAFLIPKKKKLILFIGERNGFFSGNAKYLFLNVPKTYSSKVQLYFLTQDLPTYHSLRGHGIKTLFYPGWSAIWIMLRAKVVILCDSNWFDYLKFFILFKAKKVQVWHGLGFKNLDLSNPQDPFFQLSKTRQWLRRLCGRFPTYDLFVTTSIFYSEKLFKKSFHVKKILPLGFPRNDIFFQSSFDQNLINVDCDVLKKVKILKKIGKTIILYAPTFRSSANLCKQLNIEIAKLGSMVKTLTKQKNIVLVIKSHPCSENYIFDTNSEDLFFYDFNCDIYPLLKITDLLITDYSSICQDYLLLDRPMIFFCPDLQSYIHDDKNLAFDYLNMTPGPKIHNTEELLKTIMDRDQKEDGYKEMRKTIRGLIHDHQDGEASKRIYDYLFENYLE